MKIEKFYMIHWYDAEGSTGWTDPAEIKLDNKPTVTGGFFVREDDTYLVIAATFDPDTGDINGEFRIPVKTIVKRELIWQRKRSSKKS